MQGGSFAAGGTISPYVKVAYWVSPDVELIRTHRFVVLGVSSADGSDFTVRPVVTHRARTRSPVLYDPLCVRSAVVARTPG